MMRASDEARRWLPFWLTGVVVAAGVDEVVEKCLVEVGDLVVVIVVMLELLMVVDVMVGEERLVEATPDVVAERVGVATPLPT